MSDHSDRLDEQERREMLDWQRDELNMIDCAATPPVWMTALAAEDTREDEDTRCANCNRRRSLVADVCRECLDDERNNGDW